MDQKIGIGIIVGLTFASTSFIWTSAYFTKTQKIVLGILLLFPPAQWVLAIFLGLWNKSNNSTVGFSEDKANKQINELGDLKLKKVLTEKEYKSKIKLIIEKEQVKLFLKSSEYKSLKDLKDNGILTKQEFEEKSELLKNNILKEVEKSESIDAIKNINSITNRTKLQEEDSYTGSTSGRILVIVIFVIMLISVFILILQK